MASDHELRVHRDWIGPLQPIGLVVSPPALLAAQAFPDKNILQQQQALLLLVTPPALKEGEKSTSKRPYLPLHFEGLATEVLGWKPNKLAGAKDGPPLPENLALVLPEFGETLRPTYAVPALKEDDAEWMILIQELSGNTSFDDLPEEESKKWNASPQARIERLLRETGIPIGILINGHSLRLVFAPRGESSGHVTWPVYALCEVAGRTLLSALYMLLGSARLFTLPREQRLPHILRESRKYQNVVSTKLAGQVLEALNELLRGFQSANEASKGNLLNATVREDPDHIYGGLLAVLLRLVFILYAEERGLLSSSATYVRNYSLVSLFEKLRVDAGRFPDTMDQRYGAWSRLLVLFRMVHDGAKRGDLRLPPRYGHLFDPDGWAFLEGRNYCVNRVMGAAVEVPRVADGVVLRVLEKLVLLDSDRLSYRALDVEQIGSVYQNMMGFRLQSALETSIGVGKEHVVVGLDTLLGKVGSEREKYLKESTGVELSGKASEMLREATSIADLIAAMNRRISPLTPSAVPKGGVFLQPTDERRRSGSHYTPRELTEPIVRRTLRPILESLGATPKPEQILALKVCDPAMGSGAFLVETCRQLAEKIKDGYDIHGRPSDVPPDEDILLYAQRQVAQHCLYGVDKNPLAVDLGKLSLWLATLARDHAFTFLDHSIRHGDSLVGLSREQISTFHWTPEKQIPAIRTFVDKAIAEAIALRAKIPDLANSDDVREKRNLLREADAALSKVRVVADAVVASFFSAEKARGREDERKAWETRVQGWLSGSEGAARVEALVTELRSGEQPVPCFHWEVEFPEVFARRTPGFDCFVGNPPFLGGTRISSVLGMRYFQWLVEAFPPCEHLCDLVAYFFRRTFALLRKGGALGLIATNTIAQGDTREGGLRTILRNGGQIYCAARRYRWPGQVAVVVSVVHISKDNPQAPVVLDGKAVSRISAYLAEGQNDDSPARLSENPYFSLGSKIYGQGFLFADDDPECTPLSERDRILAQHPELEPRIRPYIGGSEILTHPRQMYHRYVILLSDLESEAEVAKLPELENIVRSKVKPERDALGSNPNNVPLKRKWWAFQAHRPELYRRLANMSRVLATSQVNPNLAFSMMPAEWVFSQKAIVFAIESHAGFCVVQSRVHEIWARFFSSTSIELMSYTPSDCFETFPFPLNYSRRASLERAGEEYDVARSAFMIDSGVGLTETYNRFHSPDELGARMLKLRELHVAMDRAVLDAFDWGDIQPTCEFLLEHDVSGDEEEPPGGRRKKKPWRYRWPDEIRDEVLARLLELNAQRAKAQTSAPTSGGSSSGSTAKASGRLKGTKVPAKGQGNLFKSEDR